METPQTQSTEGGAAAANGIAQVFARSMRGEERFSIAFVWVFFFPVLVIYIVAKASLFFLIVNGQSSLMIGVAVQVLQVSYSTFALVCLWKCSKNLTASANGPLIAQGAIILMGLLFVFQPLSQAIGVAALIGTLEDENGNIKQPDGSEGFNKVRARLFNDDKALMNEALKKGFEHYPEDGGFYDDPADARLQEQQEKERLSEEMRRGAEEYQRGIEQRRLKNSY